MLNLRTDQMPVFGAHLARFAAMSKVKRPLWRCAGDLHEPMGGRCGWTDGGCAILAYALHEWLPCVSLATLADRTESGDFERHVIGVVKDLRGVEWALDGNGASPLGPDYMKSYPYDCYLSEGGPTDPGIFVDMQTSKTIAWMLREKFYDVRCCSNRIGCAAPRRYRHR